MPAPTSVVASTHGLLSGCRCAAGWCVSFRVFFRAGRRWSRDRFDRGELEFGGWVDGSGTGVHVGRGDRDDDAGRGKLEFRRDHDHDRIQLRVVRNERRDVGIRKLHERTGGAVRGWIRRAEHAGIVGS